MNTENKLIFELGHKNAIIKDNEIYPRSRNFGPKSVKPEEAELKDGSIRIYYGNKPLVYNLLDWYLKSGKTLTEDMQIFDAYRIYIIHHSIGAIKGWGAKYIEQIGLRIKFNETTPSGTTVLNVLPQPEFIKVLDGSLKFSADLSINGSAKIPNTNISLGKEMGEFGIDGKINLSTESNIAANLSFGVHTSKIMAIGRGSSRSEWVFVRNDKPLHGYDLQMAQVIMVDQFVETISYKVKLYATLELFNLIASDRETEWVDMTIQLPK